MALARPQKALQYALVCTVASVLGGCLGYAIGIFAFGQIGRPILSFYNAWPKFDKLSAVYRQYGSVAVFGAALTPFPYKVFTIASGVFRMSFPAMVAASVLGRGLRFFTVCWLIRRYPDHITRFIDKYFNLLTILFVILLALGFIGVRLFTAEGEQGEPSAPESLPAAASPTGPGETRSTPMLSENSRKQLLVIARCALTAISGAASDDLSRTGRSGRSSGTWRSQRLLRIHASSACRFSRPNCPTCTSRSPYYRP
jgi:membrane protein YqaA with SNARE-associated domain